MAPTKQARREMAGQLLVTLSSLALLIAVGTFFQSWMFVHRAGHAEGEVIQLVAREFITREHVRGTSYSPVVRFRDAEGFHYTVESEAGTAPATYRVGDRVGVLYQPNEPRKAKVADFDSLWGLPVCLGVLGSVFLLAGIATLRLK